MSLVTKSTYLRGPKGDIGLQGPRGERGLSGAPGAQGPQGESAIPASSDDLLEGFNKLFFTNERADARVAVGINNLIDSAPNSLNTLNELAAALNNNANFGSTVITSLAGKLAIAGGTMTGALILNADPISNLSAATKQYVDQATSSIVTSYNDLTDKPNLFSGVYADLTGKPTLFNGAYSSLSGKPNLATVATTGSYADLTNKPAPAQTDRLVNGEYEVVLGADGVLALLDGSTIYNYGNAFRIDANRNIQLNAYHNGIPSTWTFGTDGGLTLPYNYYIGPGEGTLGITSPGGVAIVTDRGDTNQLWQFGTDGALTIPGFVQGPNQTGLLNANEWGLAIDSSAPEPHITLGQQDGNPNRIEFRWGSGRHSGLLEGDVEILTMPTSGPSSPTAIFLSPQGGQNGRFMFSGTGNLSVPHSLTVGDGKISLGSAGNSYIESVGYGVDDPTSSLNIFAGPHQNIKLRAGFGTQAFWTFGTDGNLTLPGGGSINTIGPGTVGLTANIADPSDSYLGLAPGAPTLAGSSGVEIGAGNKAWNFDAEGVLSIPPEGDIKRNGVSVLGGGGGPTDRLVKGGKQVVLESNGYITLANSAQLYDYGNGSGNGYGITDALGSTYIGYDPGDTGGALHMDAYNGKSIRIRTNPYGENNYKDWIFDSAGVLSIPLTGDIKRNGVSVLGGGFSGSYADLTGKPTIPSDINQLSDANGLLNAGSGSSANNWSDINFDGGDFADVVPNDYDNSEYILSANELDYPTVVGAPLTASSPGETGQIAYDNDYVYVCIATNTWKRSALSSW